MLDINKLGEYLLQNGKDLYSIKLVKLSNEEIKQLKMKWKTWRKMNKVNEETI